MMPWWSWLAIWAALPVLLLAMLATMALLLFRKLMALVSAMDALAAKLEILGRAGDLLEDQGRSLAILRPYSDVLDAYNRRMRRRAARTAGRRANRIARGRMITSTPYETKDVD